MGLSGALRRLDDGAGAVLVEDDGGGNDGSAAEGAGVGAVLACKKRFRLESLYL